MDVLTIANEITPYVTAAAGAYGTAVFTRATDAGADATLTLGQRILQRIWHREAGRPGIRQALDDMAESPHDPDVQAALRVQIREALAADPTLAGDLVRLLGGAGVNITASGERSVAVRDSSGVISTGDNARVQR
ncbi:MULTISPECIES: hypothetical protein [unclassified Streptomyces]|uniref:hypothetical protein n=1 Tax=unclassified Streptomyces TaxID=2593676 RepID=UPI0013A6C87C|nr:MULTISPECIES: hypothetical protein [unclassified Streptomyces]